MIWYVLKVFFKASWASLCLEAIFVYSRWVTVEFDTDQRIVAGKNDAAIRYWIKAYCQSHSNHTSLLFNKLFLLFFQNSPRISGSGMHGA